METNISSNNYPKLLKAEQVAEILNISKAFVYQLIETGELPSIRLGRSVRVHPNVLEEMIQKSSSNNDRR